ncbi:Nitrilase [Savitreella phatthalungensis]
MNRDGHYIKLHLTTDAASKMSPAEIALPQDHEPALDDEVPNQEAINGIARARQSKSSAWQDLGLERLL